MSVLKKHKTEALVILVTVPVLIVLFVAYIVGNVQNEVKDNAIRDTLISLRKESDIYHLQKKSYAAFCLHTRIHEVKNISQEIRCFDSSSDTIEVGWAAEAKMNGVPQYYCVDYLGNSGIAGESSVSDNDVLCNIVIDDHLIHASVKRQ